MATNEPLTILIARKPGSTTTWGEEFAAWIARTGERRHRRKNGVSVRTITVLPTIWPSDEPAAMSDNHRSWIEAEAQACRHAALHALKHADVPKSCRAKEPFEFISRSSETAAITQAATDCNADFVVIESSPDAPDGRFQAGSTADALLHCAPVSLALTPRSPKFSKKGIARVNCTYVDTEQSKEALRKACDLAHLWGIPLRLVAFAPRGASMYPTQTPYHHEDEDMVEWREQALALLDRGRDRALARHADLDVEMAIGTGHDWSGAMENINWKKSDVLIVGSSTLGVFGQVFLGSSTNQIVKHSPVPTIIVPV
ncbi:MAG: universal stress protein [Bifidobacterium sp.]|nr:universal stress protein [Bifidobacterium sp.]